jgi:hypothetical protein
METWFHCMGTNSRDCASLVGWGDQLSVCDLSVLVVEYAGRDHHDYGQSHDILEPGLVKVKTGSVLSLGQQSPRFELTGIL